MEKRQWYRCPNCKAEYPRKTKCDCGSRRAIEKIPTTGKHPQEVKVFDFLNKWAEGFK